MHSGPFRRHNFDLQEIRFHTGDTELGEYIHANEKAGAVRA